MFKKSIACALALFAFLGCAAVNAAPEETIPNPSRQVIIGNATDMPIVGFFVSIAGQSDWTDNFVQEEPVMPGKALFIDFSNDEDACLFDVKAFLKDGDHLREETFSGANACTSNTMVIYLKGDGEPLAPPTKKLDI